MKKTIDKATILGFYWFQVERDCLT